MLVPASIPLQEFLRRIGEVHLIQYRILYRPCVFERYQLQVLVRTRRTASKYRLPGPVRRVRLVTGGQIRVYKQHRPFKVARCVQKAINRWVPPLYPTVILQFRLIPRAGRKRGISSSTSKCYFRRYIITIITFTNASHSMFRYM